MVRVQIQVNDFIQYLEIPLSTPEIPAGLPSVPTTLPITQCPPGQIFDALTNTCKPITQCPTGTTFDSAKNICVPVTVGPPTITAKVIKISTLKNAFRTQEIPILITATCTEPPSIINGEDATLLIDGNVIDRKTVISGTASFAYTFKDAGLHSIRVTIPRSSGCDSEGSASVQIDISSEVPSTLERLRIEREAAAGITAEIERVRQETRLSLGGI